MGWTETQGLESHLSAEQINVFCPLQPSKIDNFYLNPPQLLSCSKILFPHKAPCLPVAGKPTPTSKGAAVLYVLA